MLQHADAFQIERSITVSEHIYLWMLNETSQVKGFFFFFLLQKIHSNKRFLPTKWDGEPQRQNYIDNTENKAISFLSYFHIAPCAMAREVNFLLKPFSAIYSPPLLSPLVLWLPYLLTKTSPNVSIVLIWLCWSVNKQIGLCPHPPNSFPLIHPRLAHRGCSLHIFMEHLNPGNFSNTHTQTQTVRPLKPFPKVRTNGQAVVVYNDKSTQSGCY